MIVLVWGITTASCVVELDETDYARLTWDDSDVDCWHLNSGLNEQAADKKIRTQATYRK